jgi:hypothetical protein
MSRLRVWNKGGLPSRTIPIAGRNAMLARGRLSMIGSLAERNELDWPALEAALGADNVVVEVSPIEADLLKQSLPEKFRCGQNVELAFLRESYVRLETDGIYGWIVAPPYGCCGIGFMTPLELGRHRRNDQPHRGHAQQEEAPQDQEHEWLAATTETR